jgi:hypothetical protein
MTGEKVHLFWSFNLFGQEAINSLPLELQTNSNPDIIIDALRQRLLLHAKEYCRWGLHVTPKNIFCTSQSLFIQTVYDFFLLLYSNKLLFKEYTPNFYSIKLQRYIDSSEIKISFEKTELNMVIAAIIDVPENCQLNDVLEDELILNKASLENGIPLSIY